MVGDEGSSAYANGSADISDLPQLRTPQTLDKLSSATLMSFDATERSY